MGKYDKYICTTLQKRHMLPGPSPEDMDKLTAEGRRISMEHVFWIDDEVIPGAYYGEATWIWPTSYPNQISWEELAKRGLQVPGMFPHVHDFPELLTFYGTDPDHPEDANSMGMLMADEEIPLERSWVAYIPANMPHMPTRGSGNKATSRPVCHWTSGPGGVYEKEKNEETAAISKQQDMAKIKKTGPFKYQKYMVFGNEPHGKMPDYMHETDPKYTRTIAYIDQVVIPDAEFGCDSRWLLPGEKSKAGQLIMDAHTQPHGTSIVFCALNYDDITDLCAEVELWIGGEKHIINKGFGAYIPPDVEQGPMIIRNITRQILFMISYPIGEGIKKYRGK